jgi:hypothetical protein
MVLASFSSFAQVVVEGDETINPPTASEQFRQQNEDDEFETWCNRRLRDLDYARAQASRETLQGNYGKAASILINGLSQPVGRTFGRVNPITINLMVHAKNVGVELLNTAGNEVRGVKAASVALEAFYDLIKNAAYTVDFPYYRSNCGYCNRVNTADFEQDVLAMVSDMLSIVNDNLLIERNQQIFPVGPSRSYLKAAEIVSQAGYREMRTLLYADAYACEILDLRDIGSHLSSFNARSTTESEKKSQIYESYYDINNVINKINGGYSCGRRN